MPLAVGAIGPADPNRPLNNPFFLAAEAAAVAGDTAALKALDAQLDAAGYSRDGQVRKRIAQHLAAAGGA